MSEPGEVVRSHDDPVLDENGPGSGERGTGDNGEGSMMDEEVAVEPAPIRRKTPLQDEKQRQQQQGIKRTGSGAKQSLSLVSEHISRTSSSWEPGEPGFAEEFERVSSAVKRIKKSAQPPRIFATVTGRPSETEKKAGENDQPGGLRPPSDVENFGSMRPVMFGRKVEREESPLHDGYSKHSRASAIQERAQKVQDMIQEIGESGAKYGVRSLKLDLNAVKETSLGRMALGQYKGNLKWGKHDGQADGADETTASKRGNMASTMKRGATRQDLKPSAEASKEEEGENSLQSVKPSNPLDDWGKFSAGSEKECHECLTTHSRVWHLLPSPDGLTSGTNCCNSCFIDMRSSVCPFCGLEEMSEGTRLLCPICKRQTHEHCVKEFRGEEHSMGICVVCELEARIEHSDVSSRYRDLLMHQLPTVLNHHIFEFSTFFGTDSTSIPSKAAKLMSIHQRDRHIPVSPIPASSPDPKPSPWQAPPTAGRVAFGWEENKYDAGFNAGEESSILSQRSSSSSMSSSWSARSVNAKAVAPRVQCWRGPDMRRRIAKRHTGDASVSAEDRDALDQSIGGQISLYNYEATAMHVRCLDPSSKKVLTGLTRSAATPRMSTAASIASTTFQRLSTGASRPFTGATDSVRPYTGGTSTRPFPEFFSSRPQTGAAANVWARPTTRGNDPSMVLPPPSISGALTARPHTRGTVNFSTPGPSGGGSLTARPSTKGHADGARPYSRGDAMFTPRPGTRGGGYGARAALRTPSQHHRRPKTGASSSTSGAHHSQFLGPWPSAPEPGGLSSRGGRPSTVGVPGADAMSPRRARPAPPREPPGAGGGGGGGGRGGRAASSLGGGGSGGHGGSGAGGDGKGGGQQQQKAADGYDGIMRHITVNMESFGKDILEMVPDFVDKPAQDFLQHLISKGMYQVSADDEDDDDNPLSVAAQFEPFEAGIRRIANACCCMHFRVDGVDFGKLPRMQAALVVLRAFEVYPGLVGTKDAVSLIHEAMVRVIDGLESTSEQVMVNELKELIARSAFHIFRVDPLKLGLKASVPPDKSDSHVTRVLLEFMGLDKEKRISAFEEMFVTPERVERMRAELAESEERRISHAKSFKGKRAHPCVAAERKWKSVLEDIFYFFATEREVQGKVGSKFGGGGVSIVRYPRPPKTPWKEVEAKLERLRDEGRRIEEIRAEKRRGQGGEGGGWTGGGVGGDKFAERQMIQERLAEKVQLGKITKAEIPLYMELFTQADVIGELAKTKKKGNGEAEAKAADEKLAVFRTIDRKRDNMIDFDEFLAFYRQDMTTAKHFWAMLAPSTDSKISWGEFSGNQASALIKPPPPKAPTKKPAPPRSKGKRGVAKHERRRSMVYKDAAARNAKEMGASDAAAAAAAAAGTYDKVEGEGGEGGGGGKIAEDKYHGFDFEWVEIEESVDCLFPSRMQKPHAPLYSPRKTLDTKGVPGEEDAAAVLENLRRDAHQAMSVVRGGGRVDQDLGEDKLVEAAQKRGARSEKRHPVDGMDRGGVGVDLPYSRRRPKTIVHPYRGDTGFEDAPADLEGWGGNGGDHETFYTLEISDVFNIFRVFFCLGSPGDVEGGNALVDEGTLLNLCYKHANADDSPSPIHLLEWDNFAALILEISQDHLKAKNVRGYAYTGAPDDKVHAFFHFIAAPSPKYASHHPTWMRDRTLQWSKAYFIPAITQNPAETARWSMDGILPPRNEPWRGDGAMQLFNEVVPLPEGGIRAMCGTNRLVDREEVLNPEQQQQQQASNEEGYNEDGEPVTPSAHVAVPGGGDEALLRWYAVLVHDLSKLEEDSVRRAFQFTAWHLRFPFYSIDTKGGKSDQVLHTMGGQVEGPCVRLYSSNGRYIQQDNEVILKDGKRLLSWVKAHEDSVDEDVERSDMDLLPLALFLEVPDGSKEYLNTLDWLNRRAGRHGEKLSEPIRGILSQLATTSLTLCNMDLLEAQILAIAQAVAHSRRMRSVRIDNCRLSETGAEAVLIAVSMNPMIQVVSLCRAATPLPQFDESGNSLALTSRVNRSIEALAELLRFSRTCTELSISHFNLGDAGGLLVANSLRSNTMIPLVRLDISENGISDRVALALAQAFTALRDAQRSRNADALPLSVVNLSGNAITSAGHVPFLAIPGASEGGGGPRGGLALILGSCGERAVSPRKNAAAVVPSGGSGGGGGGGGGSGGGGGAEDGGSGGGGAAAASAARVGKGVGRTSSSDHQPEVQPQRTSSADKSHAPAPVQEPRPGDDRVMDAVSVEALLQKLAAMRGEDEGAYLRGRISGGGASTLASLDERFATFTAGIAGSILTASLAWEVMSHFLGTKLWTKACEAVYLRLGTSRDKERFSDSLEEHYGDKLRKAGRAPLKRNPRARLVMRTPSDGTAM